VLRELTHRHYVEVLTQENWEKYQFIYLKGTSKIMPALTDFVRRNPPQFKGASVGSCTRAHEQERAEGARTMNNLDR